jgi:adenosylcobinamide-GDP ribazoletransferase
MPTTTARPHHRQAPAWLRDWAGAWVFYSVLPPWPFIAPRFERIARFAPLVGLVLGGLQAVVWGLTAGWLPLAAQVALVLVLAVVLTGGLHLDGAMDTADGLGAGPRALEAMKDSRVGAAGVQALLVVLLLRGAGLICLADGPALAAPVAMVWAAFWARASPLLAMQYFPYMREQGSAGFHRQHWQGLAKELRPVLLALLVLGAVLALGVVFFGAGLRVAHGAGLGLWGPLALGATLGVVPVVVVPFWFGRRLGGHSGDSYGACVEWSEALALLLMGLLLRAAG